MFCLVLSGGTVMRCFMGLAALVCCVLAGGPAHAEKRVALVIGNGAYTETPGLTNTINDAADMAAALQRLDFTVLKGIDLDLRAMQRLIRQFERALTGADIALFFYAGHGMQVSGQNYLVPIDARLAAEGDVDFETLPLNLVLTRMEREAKTSIVLLDACRDNPLARNLARTMGTRGLSIGQGLAEVKTGIGTLLSFSTQPGNVALDGSGRNSPYTTALLAHIEEPGRDMLSMLAGVRGTVIKATGGKQVPWEHTSLLGPLVLKSATSTQVPLPSTGPPATSASPARAPEVECDRLAAHPADPQAVTSGIPIDRIDAQRAIRACDLAKSQYPGEKRFVFQLARAHGAANDFLRQKELLEELTRQDYVAAYLALGIVHFNGQGVSEDKAHGAKLFRQGAERGHVLAILSLAEALLKSAQPAERDEGVNWLRKAAQAGNVPAMLALGRTLLGSTDAGQQREAATWIEKAANAGNADAMFIIGWLHWNGQVLAQDMTKAAHWMQRGAEAGNAGTMEYFGRALLRGLGVTKDEWKAADWLRKAANAGRPSAMIQLARLYWHGTGLPKDRSEAFRRYREAAELAINTNDTEPLCTLAQINLSGTVITKDLAEAARWFTKAAEGGCTVSMVNLGVMHLEGSGGLPKDQAKAETWFRKATEIAPAALGCPFADAYLRGKVPPNLVQTVNWFTKAAEAGCPYSMYSMGVILAEGRGLPKDDAKAATWFAKARTGLEQELDDEDSDTAAAMLADMHRRGRGVPKNDAEAFRLAQTSAERGHPVGMILVGEMYEVGRGTPKNERDAAAWYRKASEAGAEVAMLHLGRLHAEGRGLAKSEGEARERFRRAARSDFVEHVWRNTLSVLSDPEFNLLRPEYQTATLMLLTLSKEPRYRQRLLGDAAKIAKPVRIALQARLKSTGHYKGPLNGTLGLTTRAALEAWAAGR
jgi:TPR repeat protein